MKFKNGWVGRASDTTILFVLKDTVHYLDMIEDPS